MLEHRWSEWEITKPSSAFSLGEKVRSCELCGEVDNGKDFTYWWVMPLIILEVLFLIICLVVLFADTNRVVAYALCSIMMFAVSIVATLTIANNPIFGNAWDAIALGITDAVNLSLMLLYVFSIIDKEAYNEIYKFAPFIIAALLAIVAVLGLTILSGMTVAVVIVMAVLALHTAGWAYSAYNDSEIGWMVANIVVTVLNVISALHFVFKI